MSVHIRRRHSALFTGCVMFALLITLLSASSALASRPIKLVLSSHFNNEFEYPESIGINKDPAKSSPHYQDLYITDRGNNRVQELTATGQFVNMFGWNVNKTKVELGSAATQAEKNLCTAQEVEGEGVECQAGVEGAAAGQFTSLQSTTVDPKSGDVYVQEGGSNMRVERYTSDGRFVWMIGKEVDATTKGNLCTAASGDVCKAGVPGTEPGGFHVQGNGNLLAVDGSGVLYVGDEHRVQEFEADGKHKGEIREPLEALSNGVQSTVYALTVDAIGDVYLTYDIRLPGEEIDNIVRKFDPEGKEVQNFEVAPREQGTKVFIVGMGLDSEGHLAVSAVEEDRGPFGSVFEAESGHLLTRFGILQRPGRTGGIAFNDVGHLYGVVEQEGFDDEPLPVAELKTTSAGCDKTTVTGAAVSLNCTLNGEVNPENVSETEVRFEWGPTCSFGLKTPLQPIGTVEELVPANTQIEVRPHATICYRLTGYDQNSPQTEEQLNGEVESFATEVVPPRIVEEPSASFIKPSSAVLFGQLNPENTKTRYEFQYGACENLENCPDKLETNAHESSIYGTVGATTEINGLQPLTTYHYRLVAVNEESEPAVNESGGSQLPEGVFETPPGPVPQATTGGVGLIGATSATISGTVDPDGLPATYAFEMGVYSGASTQYGVVFSGPAGASKGAVEETLQLTGLQPGTVYAYRIAVSSGYIDNESHTILGDSVIFTTAGLPAILSAPMVLGQLATPKNLKFPKESGGGVSKQTVAKQLVRALRSCAKKPKVKRAACKRAARKKYHSVKGRTQRVAIRVEK